MNASQFLAKNKSFTCAALAKALGVSSGTITKMKEDVTIIQGLALDALNAQERERNTIHMDITEYTDSYGNTYFSGYVYFKDEEFFISETYGYGSYCEDHTLKALQGLKLIPDVKYQSDLRNEYNITFKCNRSEVKKCDMYNGSEHTYSKEI